MNRFDFNFSSKTKPLGHQIEAIRYIASKQATALFDEQGLGKTKVVIDALCISMQNQEIEGALIVAPLSLLFNWEAEVLKHSYLIPIVLRGGKKTKKYRLLTGANFYILNYEMVVAELDIMKLFCKSHKVAIVLDEAARIKNPDSKTACAIFELSQYAKKKIIVTGTPVANKPYDLWSQFYFLDHGKLLGDSFEEFKLRFDEKKSDFHLQLNDLREVITNNSIRRLKDDVLELPEKTYENVYVELKGRQLELYNQLKNELKIEIQNIDGHIIIDESDIIIKKMLRLTQIACNPILIDKSYNETPAKFIVIKGIIDEAISKQEKIIIWSSFVDNILLLKKSLMVYNPLIIYGGTSIEDRKINVEKFQGNEKYKILIANPSAAKEGLTLTRANNAIYIDRNFNLVDYLQSQDRIHRISQNKICRIIKIIARGTIDEYIDRILEAKKDIAGYIEGDSKHITQETKDTFINKHELLEILGG